MIEPLPTIVTDYRNRNLQNPLNIARNRSPSRGFRRGAGYGGFEDLGLSSHGSSAGRCLDCEKKSQLASERDEERRGLWRWLASKFDARRLVFVDESGFHTSMTRLYARAPKGERAYGRVPRNRGKNTTLIAAITLEGAIGAPMTVEGGTNKEVFESYLKHFLLPELEAGQVVVMDNLGAHRPDRVRELIEAKGAYLVYLPTYSPDLNPIEEAFSKIKQLVRKAEARTRDALVKAIAGALGAVTTEDAMGWFSNCGYQPLDQYL